MLRPKARMRCGGRGYTGPKPAPAMTTPPPSFHDDERKGFRAPWTFLRDAAPGGLRGPGLQLMVAWALAALLPAWFWSRHLAGFAGQSALPSHWGERLPARDLVELWLNGGWGKDPVGTLPVLALLACLLWALWSGWRMQTDLLARPAKVGPWAMGLVEALILGLLPLGLVRWLVLQPLEGVGGLGIAPFSWAYVILKPLLTFACLTALSLQWSFCRVGRLTRTGGWFRHLGHSFLRLWTHPIQWTLFCLVAAALRVGLALTVLVLAWRWGGASGGRLFTFVALQVLAAALVAWTLGWQLRLAALFTQHDAEVRAELERLQAATWDVPAEEEVEVEG